MKVVCCFCTARNPEKIGNDAPPVAFGGKSKSQPEKKAEVRFPPVDPIGAAHSETTPTLRYLEDEIEFLFKDPRPSNARSQALDRHFFLGQAELFLSPDRECFQQHSAPLLHRRGGICGPRTVKCRLLCPDRMLLLDGIVCAQKSEHPPDLSNTVTFSLVHSPFVRLLTICATLNLDNRFLSKFCIVLLTMDHW
jgi:hypothetical protein